MQQATLKRDLGFISAMSIVIGCVIGSGVFLKPGVVLGSTGNTTTALLAWLVGGIITLASGLTIAELAARIPKTGGLYTYIEESYGKTWGFLSGWVQSVIYAPGIIAALGLYFSSLFVHFFALPASYEVWIAIITVLFLTSVNILGAKYGGFVQSFTTFAKLIPILLIVVFGLWKGDAQVLNAIAKSTEEMSFSAAVLATLFAYDGWILVGSVAGELKNPSKTLPKAITAGLLIVTASYLFINIAILKVLPAQTVVDLGENAASTAAGILFGGFGGKILTIGIMISIFGSLNGKILSYPRIPFAMAQRKQLPFSRYLAKVSPRWNTPVVSILGIMSLSILYMFFSDPNWLTDVCTFTIFLFYILSFFAVFKMRKNSPNSNHEEYRVPLYPVIPIIAIFGSGFIIVNTAIEQTNYAIFSILLTVVGLPIFWWQQRRNKHQVESPIIPTV